MIYSNNATLLRRDLITRLAKLYLEGDIKDIDRIPLQIAPRNSVAIRGSIAKDRAVLKYMLMALLGYNISDEEDELMTLAEYAKKSIKNEDPGKNILTVVDEACSSCIKTNYIVTNLCRGCVARPCTLNCPKNAISFIGGRAQINTDLCINCGKCMAVCPYHAIVYVPVPCEESCPVKAISKDENGIEHIDNNKCIHCGKCALACPFGAIMAKSQIIKILKRIKDPKEKIIALVAPAIIGQFKASLPAILEGIKKIGFDKVIEVADAAVIVAENETKEFLERMENGDNFMTTSCCPAYTELVRKHIPQIQKNVSNTRSPMHFSAKYAKEHFPEYSTVFIGPCIAKQFEGIYDEYVDNVMSFEELGSLFIAMNIDLSKINITEKITNESEIGRWFAASGGVSNAIAATISDPSMIKGLKINGIDKRTVNLLKAYSKKCPGNFIEVMACEGGCIAGPVAVCNPKVADKQLKKFFEDNKK